jgi:anti-anti-sigma factor
MRESCVPELLFTTTVNHEEDSSIVHCAGELDISTSQLLADAIEEALDRSPATVYVDLRNTTFFAAVGGDLLLDLVTRCREKNVDLHVSASGQVRRVLDLVNFPSEVIRSETLHHRFVAALHRGRRAGTSAAGWRAAEPDSTAG